MREVVGGIAVHAVEFPIPMRGNEWWALAGERSHQMFPIPMRGNERSHEWAALAVAVVPNPHEG